MAKSVNVSHRSFAFDFATTEELAQHLIELREAAQESLVVLGALLLDDGKAEREGGLRLYDPQVLDSMRRAHDLLWYALLGLKQHESKGQNLDS